MRAYLETSVLIVHCFGKKLERERYTHVEALFDKIRIQYSQEIKLNDASDIPHAISAIIEKCDCIITYDSHFYNIDKIITIMRPEEL